MPTEVNTSRSSQRVGELDALRAMAAINLMLFHFTHVYTVKYGYSLSLGWEWPYGKYGVQLFFMLSGYVNAMTLFRKQQPGEFVVNRLIRIVPLFWLVTGLNLVVLLMSPHAGVITYSWGQFLANLTIVPNLLGYQCLEPVTWTLQVELLFYVVIVGLFYATQRVGLWRPLLLYLGFCVVAGRLLLGYNPDTAGLAGQSAAWLGQLFIVKYFPLFAMGIALHELRSGRSKHWICLSVIALAGIVFHAIDDHDHNPIVTALLLGLLSLAAYGRLPWLSAGPLLFVSGISYSLYLLHNNLGCVLISQLDSWGLPANVSLVLAIAASVLLAGMVTHGFERPLSQRLKSIWKAWRTQDSVQPHSSQPNISTSTPSR